MESARFLSLLQDAGFNFFTGVPCSYFKPLLQLLEEMPGGRHLSAPREDLAVALSAGAWLAGKTPVVYMQNSGLGYSLEALASLHLIYRIPTLILLSHRGPTDLGWEEHRVMGEKTTALLDTFCLDYLTFSESIDASAINSIHQRLTSERSPCFLLIGKDSLS